MTLKKIYGPWIEWNGGECPVPPDTFVEVKLRCAPAGSRCSRAGDYYWNHDDDDDDGDIVSYRTITEQAALEAAEKLLLANGYTITPPAKPLTFEDVVPMTEEPPEGTYYWIVSLTHPRGAVGRYWTGSPDARLYLKRRIAYLDKEHALIAARHIFGLKGGEL